MGAFGDSKAIARLMDVLPSELRGSSWWFIKSANGRPFIRLNTGLTGEALVMPVKDRWRFAAMFPGHDDVEADLGPLKGDAGVTVAELSRQLLYVAQQHDNGTAMQQVMANACAFAWAAQHPGFYCVASERYGDWQALRGLHQDAVVSYEYALGACDLIRSQPSAIEATKLRLAEKITHARSEAAAQTAWERET